MDEQIAPKSFGWLHEATDSFSAKHFSSSDRSEYNFIYEFNCSLLNIELTKFSMIEQKKDCASNIDSLFDIFMQLFDVALDIYKFQRSFVSSCSFHKSKSIIFSVENVNIVKMFTTFFIQTEASKMVPHN